MRPCPLSLAQDAALRGLQPQAGRTVSGSAGCAVTSPLLVPRWTDSSRLASRWDWGHYTYPPSAFIVGSR